MHSVKKEVLELLREDWKSARELAVEVGAGMGEVKQVLKELEEKNLVFRDGPLYIHRLGRH